MSRNPEYQFIETDSETVVSLLVTAFEKLTGTTVQPASPEKIFIQWVASIIIQERVLTNYTGNQNIPSRAEGENLDALGELFYEQGRPAAQAAVSTVRFYISEAQDTAILVPAGTRVTDVGSTLIWETTEDAYVAAGDTYVDVSVQCQTVGTVGNGYTAGQINTIVDVYDYYSACENLTESDGGSDEATDEEYYELLRASMDAYSTAGPRGAYEYWAKQVSTEIEDVKAICPLDENGERMAGYVYIYALMNDGFIASDTIKQLIYEACSADTVRPMTDYVFVKDPDVISYDVELTYYIQTDSAQSAADIQDAVEEAVNEYTAWQQAKIGRDINPSKLYQYLMATGVKRVEITSPAFTALEDGSDGKVPQIAAINSITITSGGYEDE